jgi:hypothetical protein
MKGVPIISIKELLGHSTLVHNGSFLAQYQASGGAQAQWEYAVAAGDRHFEQTSRGTREILVFRMRSKNGISIIG